VLSEPRTGKARALNHALRHAGGELLAFTDDDCRLHAEHLNDLLRHASGDTDLVLRGGQIEPGDAADLRVGTDTRPERILWHRTATSVREENVQGCIIGCNMTMRRALIERLGPFDEDFGPGTRIGSGDDTEFAIRTYLAGFALEHVRDMTVFHHHGRKTSTAAHSAHRRYIIGSGALTVKYGRHYPVLRSQAYWDMKDAVKEFLTGINTRRPEIGFSHRDHFTCLMRGALRYLFMRRHHSAWTRWDEECRSALAATAAARHAL
jgi:GT2 family glycosyltransferase